MNDVILEELYKNKNKYVPSDRICERLNISRIAVWNRIKFLKKQGYKIHAKRGVGYRLLEEGRDILIPYEVKRRLKTSTLGREIVFLPSVTSTMDKAGEISDDPSRNGTLIIADQQTHGRGRKGRHWVSPPGKNVYASVVYYPRHMSIGSAIMLIFATAVAIVKAVAELGVEGLGIKWPNDVMLNGKKIAGVLVETRSEAHLISSAVVGFGINVNMEELPESLRNVATSLKIETGKHYDRAELLASVLLYLETLIEELERGNSDLILSMWKLYDTVIGRRIEVRSDGEVVSGVAVDVDDDGFLIVNGKGFSRRIITSDSIRILEDG